MRIYTEVTALRLIIFKITMLILVELEPGYTKGVCPEGQYLSDVDYDCYPCSACGPQGIPHKDCVAWGLSCVSNDVGSGHGETSDRINDKLTKPGSKLHCQEGYYLSHVDFDCYPCSPCGEGDITHEDCLQWGLPQSQACVPGDFKFVTSELSTSFPCYHKPPNAFTAKDLTILVLCVVCVSLLIMLIWVWMKFKNSESLPHKMLAICVKNGRAEKSDTNCASSPRVDTNYKTQDRKEMKALLGDKERGQPPRPEDNTENDSLVKPSNLSYAE